MVTHFDTKSLGVHDPEGIGFYSATGHLFITDSYSKTKVAEVTISGVLVQIIDISAASAIKPSGLGFGPSSIDPEITAMYVTDRVIDNNANADENDGKVYELSIPGSQSINIPPTVNITDPENEAVFTEGDAVTFSGNASDSEDGDLTASINWTSTNGENGIGSTFTLNNLSRGTYTITASVTDSNGTTKSTNVSITVNPVTQPANNPPTVNITSPLDGVAYNEGDSVIFSGSASDIEDGDLSKNINWTSSIDGIIGIGNTFTLTNLSVGNHNIIASVTDSNGVTNSNSVSITVSLLFPKFTPTDDAKVSSINPNKSYGSLTYLELRNSNYTVNSYLKFNVTGLSGTVKTAKIRLYSASSCRYGGSIYVVSNNYNGTDITWSEGGLTYNNAPIITGEPLSTAAAVTAYSWVDFDVTAAIDGDGEYSFGLMTSSKDIKYNSSEADLNQPELIIETL